MNRPKREDYYDVVAFNVKTGDKHKMFTCSGNAIKYMNDLECYCDALESKFEIALGTVVILDEKLNYLEKALDKATRYLTYDHFTPLNEIESEEMAHWEEDDWKEFLLKDE